MFVKAHKGHKKQKPRFRKSLVIGFLLSFLFAFCFVWFDRHFPFVGLFLFTVLSFNVLMHPEQMLNLHLLIFLSDQH